MSHNICLTYSELISIGNDSLIKYSVKTKQKIEIINQLSLQIQDIIKEKFSSQQVNKLNLFTLIDFEEQINLLKKEFFSCVEQLKESYILIGQQQIDLNQANSILTKCYDNRQALLLKIKELLKSNNQSDELKHLCFDYDNYLSPNYSVSMQFDDNKKNKFLYRVRDFYNNQSCLFSVSLLKEDFGKIISVSKNFRRVFKCNDDFKAIGIPLSIFVPTCIVPDTYERGEQLISDYLHVYNKIIDIQFLIAKTKSGFALPVVSKLQTQALDSKQFGIVVWVKPIIDRNLYIVLNSQKSNQIETLSEDLISYLYQGFSIKSDLKDIKVENLIPILQEILQQKTSLDGELTTIYIKPENKLEVTRRDQYAKQNIYKDLQRKDIFKIDLSIKQVRNDYQSFTYITIYSCVRPQSEKQRRQLINNYMQQLSVITTQIEQDGIMEQLDTLNDDLNSEEIKKNEQLQQQLYQKFNLLKHHFQSFSSLGSDSQSKQKQCGKMSKFQIEFREKSVQDISITHSHADLYENIKVQSNDHNFLGIDNQKSEILDLDNNSSDYQGISLNVPKQLNDDLRVSKIQRKRSSSEPQKINHSNQYNKTLSKFKEENLMKQSLERNALKVSQNIFFQHEKQENSQKNDNLKFSHSKTPSLSDSSSSSSSTNQNNERASIQISVCSSATNYTQKYCFSYKNYFFILKTLFQKQSKLKIILSFLTIFVKDQIIDLFLLQTNRQLIRSIHKRIKMKSVKLINCIGFISLLIIIALNVQGYYQYLEKLFKQQDNFKYINWLYQMNIHVSQSYSEYNIKLQQDYGLFKIADPKTNKDFTKFIQDLLDSRHILSRDLLVANLNCTQDNIEVFQIMNDYILTQTMYSSNTSSVNITVSMLQSINIQVAQLYHFIYQHDPLRLYRFTGEKNYPAINSLLRKVVNIQNENYEKDLDNIIKQQELQMYIIIPISFVFFASLIPIYAYVRNKHQKIIELFSTIEPSFLKLQINDLHQLLARKQISQASKSQKKKDKKLQNSQQHQQEKLMSHNSFFGAQFGDLKVTKKGNISQVNTITYSVKWLVVTLIILFLCNITYPLASYGILLTFMKNSQHVYRFNNAFQEAYFLLINCLRARQGLAVSYFLPQYSSQKKEVYQKLFMDLVPQVTEVLNMFKDQLEVHHQADIHNQEQFDDFVINLLQKNACEVIDNYPNYQNGDFNRTLCESVGKNILQKGFYDGVQMFYLIFIDNSRFIFQDTPELYQVQYDIFNRQINGYNQLKFKAELTKIMDYSFNFFQQYNNDLYTYYEIISSIAFFLQIAFLIIMYFFGWRIYYNQIDLIIFKAKELLDILPSSVLIQNRYILTFLQQQK